MTWMLRAFVEHPFAGAVLLLAAEVAAAVLLFGTGIDGMQAAARYSGRFGLLPFALVFAAGPLARLRPGPLVKRAVARRRQLGLAFALHHFVHLALLVAYLHAAGKAFDPARAAGGALGYAFLAVMAATSNDASVRALGPSRWRVLHRIGAWYLWVAFLMTWVPRLQGQVEGAGGSPAAWAAGLAVVLALALLRGAAFAASRRRAR